jgi:serine/threonine protein kinase/Tfp pilus assembly protein PilF
MADKSTFGAEPEGIDRLLAMYLEESDSDEDALARASRNQLLERPGGWIGQYKLLSVLGEGGMGIVYLAEQAQPIKRTVALKIIKPGMDSKRVIARFEAERQALALLDHPNIAHVHDAGTTNSGRPYFAMEYVEGLPITEYCDHHKLTIDERLKLFLKVCHAVNHAHQKGIIHRDIKPSNILVSTLDNQAVPKMIDFGVAKALGQSLTGRTLITEQGLLFGTPEYMSPEQANMAEHDIDTRSDIYSLGMLLYVLLTGALPFDAKNLREGGFDNILRVICETHPKTPSTRLTSLGEEAKKVAENRRMEVQTLAKHLRKELEWIPMKAMRKERSERYRSALELADDIENYLKGNPLIAGPPSTIYRLKKFVRRNAALSSAVSTSVVTLIVGLIVATAMYVQADHARAEAQHISEFLQKSITFSLNLRSVEGKEITIRSILDTISEGLREEFQDQPLFEASVLKTLISAYGVLGLYELAESHAKRAIEINQTQLGPENIATQYSRYQLGWIYMLQGRYSEAEPLLTNSLASFELAFDEEYPDKLYCMAFLGWVYNSLGSFSEAEELFKWALETALRTRGTEHHLVPFLMYMWASAHRIQGRYREAENLYLRGLEIRRRAHNELHDDTLFLKAGLGALYTDMGRYDEAEEFLQAALKGRRKVWGETHQETLWVMVELSWLYHSQGQYKKAEELLGPALETARQVLGETHLLSMYTMYSLGTLYLSQGRCDEAEPLLEKTLDNMCNVMGKDNWCTLRVMNALAKLYEAQEHYQKADSLFNETLKGRINKLGEDHPDTLETKNDLAVLYKEQCDYKKAELLLIQAVEGRRLKLGDTHPHTIESMNNLIDLYKVWNKPEKAEEWRIKLPKTEAASE